MEEKTIEEIKAAIRSQGKRIKADATDEEVKTKYETLVFGDDVTVNGSTAPVEPVPGPDRMTATEVKSRQEVKLNPLATEYDSVLASADRLKGDKDTIVIEWCRENLSKAEFEARYSHRGIK